MIRILIVEDSITQREILRQVIEADDAFEVAGEALNGAEAVRLVSECRPDVVLMDIHMPEVDGIEATLQIMSECPVPIVIVSATLRRADVDHGLQALEAGAVSILSKPSGAALLNLNRIAPELRQELLAAAHANVRPIRRPVSSHPAPRTTVAESPSHGQPAVVGICASTGGPAVLSKLLAGIPAPYPLPILLVQHISANFAEGFANWLGAKSGQPVSMAVDGQRLTAGVWLGPPGRHLIVRDRTQVKLLREDGGRIHCPSGDPLFESLSQHFGASAIGVQLTGMGDDGARGLLRLKEAGSRTLVQDEATSLIYGMPRVAHEIGAATMQGTPDEIAAILTEAVRGEVSS